MWLDYKRSGDKVSKGAEPAHWVAQYFTQVIYEVR